MQFSYWATIGQTFDDIRAGAQFAADAGWRGVWVPDHFMPVADSDNGPGPTDAEMGPMLEGWVTLGALAGSVEEVRLGLMVGGNTYRHPAVVAKMALTLDNISGGRAVLGLGAGWQLNEHQRFGIPLPSVKDRSDMLEEAVALCRVMFEAGDGRVDFTGSHYQLTQAPVAPGPVNGRLPIMVGGAGPSGRCELLLVMPTNGTPGAAPTRSPATLMCCADIATVKVVRSTTSTSRRWVS